MTETDMTKEEAISYLAEISALTEQIDRVKQSIVENHGERALVLIEEVLEHRQAADEHQEMAAELFDCLPGDFEETKQ